MLQRIQLELWVGIFVALGLLALAMLALRVGNLSTADVVDGYKLEAHFDNIGSLKVKSPVTMAGVRIGRVSQIGFDYKNYQALVILNIDGDRKITRLNSSHSSISYAVFCLKKKNKLKEYNIMKKQKIKKPKDYTKKKNQ